jgi:hypothetical protein
LASQTTYLGKKIESLLNTIPVVNKQRVTEATQLQVQAEEQRVMDDTPIITIPCITDLPTIMQTRNPSAKRALKGTKCFHRHITRNNTPDIMPVPAITQDWDPNSLISLQCSTRMQMQMQMTQPGRQHAVNVLTVQEQASFCMVHTPQSFMKYAKMHIKYEHYACPMVHPIMGQTKTSHKNLMRDPAMLDVKQTAFGRVFGGMA